MALTATEKATIRRHLGYPDVNRLPSASLEGALDALSPEGEEVVRDLLTRIAAAEARGDARGATSNIKRAEEVEFFGPAEAAAGLRADLRRLIDQLAATLDVQIRNRSGAGGGPCGRG